ncbi:MAG: hypothetical protein IKF14_01855 [Atopobiaceae bacterium]|nr:hypothetical protein [Atopobiaceae bacterium]
MIRTNSVMLTTLPNAIAYRRKSESGGAAIVIIRADEPQPGIAAISKTSGAPIVMDNTPSGPYPADAFEEAIERTSGMPYRKQGKPAAPQITSTASDELVADMSFGLSRAMSQTISSLFLLPFIIPRDAPIPTAYISKNG